MEFYEAVKIINECETQDQLLCIVEKLVINQSKYRLDDYQMAKLEEIGTNKYEKINRDMTSAMRNNNKGRK
jgi:hypothetical protein